MNNEMPNKMICLIDDKMSRKITYPIENNISSRIIYAMR